MSWAVAVALCLWTVSGACSGSLSAPSGRGGAGGTGGHLEGAGGHLGLGGGTGGSGGLSGAAGMGVGGLCGGGCYPTYYADASRKPCDPGGPVVGQPVTCESTCGAYRVVRWTDFADAYACYYDQAGNLVSGRVMGTCSDPANYDSGPDIICPGADGGTDASLSAAPGP